MADSALSVREVVDRAIAAERALADLGETVEDEWSFVNELEAAWAVRLGEIAARHPGDTVDAAVAEAVAEAITETEAIVDPHRAIDWLSTFPQVVLLALAEPS